jgi:hypothetical protein
MRTVVAENTRLILRADSDHRDNDSQRNERDMFRSATAQRGANVLD